LRARLWKEHLNLKSPIKWEDDPMASAKHWFSIPADAYVEKVPLEDLKDDSKFAFRDPLSSTKRNIIFNTDQIDPRGDQ
jgi:hypothetical protein